MTANSAQNILLFFKKMIIATAAPLLGILSPSSRRFPTRTIEVDDFWFDPTTATVHWKDKKQAEPYLLIIDGLVKESLRLNYSELRSLPTVVQVSDFHCVEGWTVPKVNWTGFRFRELLGLVRPLDGADFVTFHSLGHTTSSPGGQGHYRESFSLADLLDPAQEILVALDMDGQPLSHDRGAPIRVIAPYRQAYKSIKFVYRLEFTSTIQPGWWTLANPIYDIDAHVPKNRLENR
jgi:DMSO/TMAO reductase YedYZ molybdopterin-dependent catalytic subunit